MPELNPDGISIKGCSTIYAPKGQAGEYAPLATNPYRGCGHGCAYCLTPDTIIQMADGTTRPLSDVQIGDDLIGVTNTGANTWPYRFAESRVLNKIKTRKPAFRVTLEDGHSAICSGDHRWLADRGWKYTTGAMSGNGQRPYLTLNNSIRTLAPYCSTPVQTADYRQGYLAGMIRGDATLKRYDYSGRFQRAGRGAPQLTDVQHHFRLALKDIDAIDRSQAFLAAFGIETDRFEFAEAIGARAPMSAIRNHNRIAFEAITALIEPKAESSEWRRGWLAGIFDAEGSFSSVIRISNSDEGILVETEAALHSFGFSTIRDVANASGVTSLRILGGLAEVVRFFNLTAPAISRKFAIIGQAGRTASKIASIEPLGEMVDMIDITTSTENFVANGMISHNCYVPKVLKMDRREFDSGAKLRPTFFDSLRKDAAKYKALGSRGQVMLSFTTDPYHRDDTAPTRTTLEILRDHGLGFCTLTKGGTRALRDIDLFRPDRDAFASTMTSLDPAFSRKWERNAAEPDDRMAALRAFHDAGIFTWVSLEPTLDIDASLAIVRATHKFVDLFKVGRVNYLPMTKTTDWRDYTLRMIDLLNQLGARHYFKRDLQGFLPDGYPNPLRVPQHH